MTEIEDLKNIRPKTGRQLREVDISTYAELAQVGVEGVFQRIYFRYKGEMNFSSVYLYALEGAIEGLHWNDIRKVRKDELKAFFHNLTSC